MRSAGNFQSTLRGHLETVRERPGPDRAADGTLSFWRGVDRDWDWDHEALLAPSRKPVWHVNVLAEAKSE